MIAGGAKTANRVDFRLHHIAHFQRALLNRAVMTDDVGLDLEGIDNREAHQCVREHAVIAHLTTRFGVERRVIEHDDGLLAHVRLFHRGAVHIERDHFGVVEDFVLVAVERGFRAGVIKALCRLELTGRASLFALTRHGFVEGGFVNRDAALAAYVGRQIQRETERVMQLERKFAVQLLGALGVELRQCRLEHRHAMLDRLEETLFFLPQNVRHACLRVLELRICRAHFLDQIRHELMEKRVFAAEFVTVADRAAHDPAQHITAAFVAGNHAVDDQERARANMVRDHLQRIVREIRRVGFAGCSLDQRLEQVDLIVAVNMLEHGGEALEAHARIDALLRQLRHVALGVAIELHEHEIPDLDEAVAVLFRRPGRAAPHFRAVIVEHFRARTARAGVAHGPEVIRCVARALVVADTDDPFFRHADFVFPNAERFVVFLIDRDRELFRRQSIDFGQQFPAIVDRVALEIVAEREVAEHFEERVMAGCVADVFEVVVLAAGAHAALRGRGARIRTALRSEEYVLELDHAGVREQQRGIVAGHKARRADDRMALRFKELEEFLADVGGFHGVRVCCFVRRRRLGRSF